MSQQRGTQVDMSATIFVVTCPHCSDIVAIAELNCRIFRHGILKANFQQIDPHASEALCAFYVANNLIYGCGKPFTIIDNLAVACDYV